MSGIAIKITNRIVNEAVFTIIVLIVALACYALWDSYRISSAADSANYAAYKPSATDEGKSFGELQALNPEVFAWLTVYGTNIDYPVAQGQDNMKYVNTNAEGLYSLTGSIFLDSANSMDFSDFVNILYGHHMEKQTMFGEVGEFNDPAVFGPRKYGNLYFGGRDHGIEFFAFVHTDAYDREVFSVNVSAGGRQARLDALLKKSLHVRDIGVSVYDNLILLTTCSTSTTNGRDVLIGRITDTVYADTFGKDSAGLWKKWLSLRGEEGFTRDAILWKFLILTVLLLLVARIALAVRNRNNNNSNSYKQGKRQLLEAATAEGGAKAADKEESESNESNYKTS